MTGQTGDSSSPERAGSMARFSGVRKEYGELVALSGLDLEVIGGEVLGLVGPNGAGKTTALSILCGLTTPSAGVVEICGHDVAADPLEARRRLSFVPDGAPLYANLSPRQHLELVGRLHGIPEERIESDAERMLEALELKGRIDSPVGGFSRGMRQKAALACALLPEPELLVLDEPLSGLDAPTATVFKEVLRAWAERGSSVLYTSHLLDVVERVCDRVAILVGGELVALGDLDELRARAGNEGTLEEVFGALAITEDPREKARRLLTR